MRIVRRLKSLSEKGLVISDNGILKVVRYPVILEFKKYAGQPVCG
jgi:hypothetical protein